MHGKYVLTGLLVFLVNCGAHAAASNPHNSQLAGAIHAILRSKILLAHSEGHSVTVTHIAPLLVVNAVDAAWFGKNQTPLYTGQIIDTKTHKQYGIFGLSVGSWIPYGTSEKHLHPAVSIIEAWRNARGKTGVWIYQLVYLQHQWRVKAKFSAYTP